MSAPAQGVLLLAPALAVYALFAVYPMLDVVALSFMKWNGLTATKQFVGHRQLRPGFHPGPGVLAGGAQHGPVDRVVGRFPTGDRLRVGARAQSEHSRPKSAAGVVLYAGHHRADRRGHDVAMDVRPVLRPVQRHADGARPARAHSGLARRSQRRALCDVHCLRLADRRLFARPVSRRIAERLADADRSVPNRRRGTVSGVPLRHAARASAVDHHRPDPLDHQFPEGLRHRLRHDRRRSGAIDANAGSLGLHPGDATWRLRTRRGDLGRPAPDHHRDRDSLSALDPHATARRAHERLSPAPSDSLVSTASIRSSWSCGLRSS